MGEQGLISKLVIFPVFMVPTMTQRYLDVQFRYRQVRCKICHGTGIDTSNSAMGERCERCEGTGWRLFPDGPTETCPACSGRGKDFRFNRRGVVCQDCDGFGEVKLL